MVLAVTKMLSGMCMGGISLESGQWIRPVKQFGTILPGDLRYADGSPMRPFDVVDLTLTKPQPRPPHVEDWVCDYVRSRPVLVRRLGEGERRELLEKHADSQALADFKASKLSLCLAPPEQVRAMFSLDAYSGKYDSRLQVPSARERGIPVTDIKWRALGRKLVGEGGRVVLNWDQLQETTGAERVYPALGLSRLYEGKHWPLVVGVHCLPDYEAEIDYGNL